MELWPGSTCTCRGRLGIEPGLHHETPFGRQLPIVTAQLGNTAVSNDGTSRWRAMSVVVGGVGEVVGLRESSRPRRRR